MMDARKMSALRNAPRRVIAEADRERVIQEFTHVVKAMAHRLAFRLPAYMDPFDSSDSECILEADCGPRGVQSVAPKTISVRRMPAEIMTG